MGFKVLNLHGQTYGHICLEIKSFPPTFRNGQMDGRTDNYNLYMITTPHIHPPTHTHACNTICTCVSVCVCVITIILSFLKVNGVKGPTVLSTHKHLVLLSAVVIDDLHCIYLGVTKHMLHLWFGTQFKRRDFSIRNKVHIAPLPLFWMIL